MKTAIEHLIEMLEMRKSTANLVATAAYELAIKDAKSLINYASSRSMDSQWISVEDKKPEIGVIVNLVLKHSKEDVYSGFRANGGWYCFQVGENPKHYIPNGIENVKITHWQPLPPPPTK